MQACNHFLSIGFGKWLLSIFQIFATQAWALEQSALTALTALLAPSAFHLPAAVPSLAVWMLHTERCHIPEAVPWLWCKAALPQAAPMGAAQPGAAGVGCNSLLKASTQGDKQEQQLITLLKWRTKNKMKRRKILCWQVCLQMCPLKQQPALGAVQCPGGMAGAVQSSLSAFQPCAASGGASSNEIQWTASWHWSLEIKTNLWASLGLRFPLFSF